MREIVYRNLASTDKRQRDVLLLEQAQQNGQTTRLSKRCTYAVKGRLNLQDPAGPTPWSDAQIHEDTNRPRQVFIRKIRNTATGEEQFTYKLLGHCYAVVGTRVFAVTYRHALHMEIDHPNNPPA